MKTHIEELEKKHGQASMFISSAAVIFIIALVL